MRIRLLLTSAVLCLLVHAPRVHACNYGRTTMQQPVTRTFSTGAQWTMYVTHDNCTGMVLQSISYKPPGGTATQVLSSANIAEVHVPYNGGYPRYLDIGSSAANQGLGDLATTLTAAECPGGTLIDNNRICYRNHDDGYAWKKGNGPASFKMNETLEIFMTSQAAQYNYVNLWVFKMDGSIEVKTGLTGSLQEVTASADPNFPAFAGRANAETASPSRYGLDHQHNVYYRLDFDIGGSANDLVSRRYTSQGGPTPSAGGGSCTTAGQCQSVEYEKLTTERSQTWSQQFQNAWLVSDKVLTNADGRLIGYEIMPGLGGTWRGMTPLMEVWAGAELWVSRYDPCELIATGNSALPLPPACPPSSKFNVEDFINDHATTDGQDIVVWYAQRFLHHVRDEDGCGGNGDVGCPDFKMPIEYMSFTIEPRNFSHKSPIP